MISQNPSQRLCRDLLARGLWVCACTRVCVSRCTHRGEEWVAWCPGGLTTAKPFCGNQTWMSHLHTLVVWIFEVCRYVKLEINQFLHILPTMTSSQCSMDCKDKTWKGGWRRTTNLQLSLCHLQCQVCDASCSDAGSCGCVKFIPDCVDIDLSKTTAEQQ